MAFSMRHQGIENVLGPGQDFEIFDEYCTKFVFYTVASTIFVLLVLLIFITYRFWSRCYRECDAAVCRGCKITCPGLCCRKKKRCGCLCAKKVGKGSGVESVDRWRECVGSLPVLQWFWAPVPYSFPRADFLKPGKGGDTVTSHVQVQEPGGDSCWVSREVLYARFWNAAQLIEAPKQGDLKSGWVSFLIKRFRGANPDDLTISPCVFNDMVAVMQYRMSTRYLDAGKTAAKFIRGTGNDDMGDQFQRKLFHQFDRELMRWSHRIPPLGLADEAIWDMLGMTVVPDHGEGDFLRKLKLHIIMCLNMKTQWRHLLSDESLTGGAIESLVENANDPAPYQKGYITMEAKWWFAKYCNDEGGFLKAFKGQLDPQAYNQTRKDPEYCRSSCCA